MLLLKQGFKRETLPSFLFSDLSAGISPKDMNFEIFPKFKHVGLVFILQN